MELLRVEGRVSCRHLSRQYYLDIGQKSKVRV